MLSPFLPDLQNSGSSMSAQEYSPNSLVQDISFSSIFYLKLKSIFHQVRSFQQELSRKQEFQPNSLNKNALSINRTTNKCRMFQGVFTSNSC